MYRVMLYVFTVLNGSWSLLSNKIADNGNKNFYPDIVSGVSLFLYCNIRSPAEPQQQCVSFRRMFRHYCVMFLHYCVMFLQTKTPKIEAIFLSYECSCRLLFNAFCNALFNVIQKVNVDVLFELYTVKIVVVFHLP